MTRRGTLAIATFALLLSAGTARAQGSGFSLAVGAALPMGALSSSAGTGLEIAGLIRTDPMIGPLALRIEIGYDHFASKGGNGGTTISTEAVSLVNDFNSTFYWAAGAGYYQSQIKTSISGHNVTEQQQFLGVQAALGMNYPLFRWTGFVEVDGTRLFAPGLSIAYVPLRVGIRL